MPLPKFDYFTPRTLEEACSLLSQHRGQARVIAGGTDLLVRMKQRVARPRYLVDIKSIPNLGYIEADDKRGLRIGAATTLHRLETSRLIRERFPTLAAAAGSVASTQIRHMGTIGGNISLETRCWYYNQSHRWRLSRPPCFKTGGERCYVVKGGDRCYSLFSADTVVPLVALGAKIRTASSGGERVLALEELYTGTGEPATRLQPDEIIAEVQIPSQPPHSGGAYLKHSLRGAIDFALVSAASVITVSPNNGACSEARIVLGAIASAPIRALKAEESLQGREISNDAIQQAAELATKEAGPIVYIAAPVDYKRRLLTVVVKQVIKKALGRTELA